MFLKKPAYGSRAQGLSPALSQHVIFFVLGGGYFSLIFLFLFVFLLVLEILVKWKGLWLLDYYLKFSLILSHFLTPAHNSRPLWCQNSGGCGHKACGCSKPRPMEGFSSNFQGILPPRGSRADKVFRVSGDNYYHGNTEYFWVLMFVGVPQPKPMHGFSPNFQGMFTPRGSRAQ